jgi:hypothetical protein
MLLCTWAGSLSADILTEESIKLLARVGNEIVNVPVVDRTQFGNDEGWITWIRTPGGAYEYDFTVLDRYLDLVRRHCGVPRHVALHVWHAGGWKHRAVDDPNTVTVLDTATGKKGPMPVPRFGTSESTAFWTAALNAIEARLARYGMAGSACLGILSDSTAPPEVLRMFAAIKPAWGWMRGCHRATRAAEPYPIEHGTVVVLHEHCYGMALPDPEERLEPIWQLDTRPAVAYFRSDFDHMTPLSYRTMAERAIYQGKRGVGRVGLDFWDFLEDDERVKWQDVYNRWPRSSCYQRRPTLMKLAGRGPSGPTSTTGFELFLEGLQMAETMIYVAGAMEHQAAAMGPELVARCQALVLDRITRCRILNAYRGPAAWDHTGWLDRVQRAFALAGEVRRTLEQDG